MSIGRRSAGLRKRTAVEEETRATHSSDLSASLLRVNPTAVAYVATRGKSSRIRARISEAPTAGPSVVSVDGAIINSAAPSSVGGHVKTPTKGMEFADRDAAFAHIRAYVAQTGYGCIARTNRSAVNPAGLPFLATFNCRSNYKGRKMCPFTVTVKPADKANFCGKWRVDPGKCMLVLDHDLAAHDTAEARRSAKRGALP
eukprot:Opistho-2@82843